MSIITNISLKHKFKSEIHQRKTEDVDLSQVNWLNKKWNNYCFENSAFIIQLLYFIFGYYISIIILHFCEKCLHCSPRHWFSVAQHYLTPLISACVGFIDNVGCLTREPQLPWPHSVLSFCLVLCQSPLVAVITFCVFNERSVNLVVISVAYLKICAVPWHQQLKKKISPFLVLGNAFNVVVRTHYRFIFDCPESLTHKILPYFSVVMWLTRRPRSFFFWHSQKRCWRDAKGRRDGESCTRQICCQQRAGISKLYLTPN